MAILSTAGYVTVVSVRETARENKLETDVANLNSSVQMYQASGGNLSDLSDVAGDTTEQKVLNKLKTRGDDDAVAYQMGMKGSFVDVRTMAVTQSADEAGTSQSRAVWNTSTQRFYVAKNGDAGVKEFQLDESLAAADIVREARERSLTASDVNSDTPVWVWDYTDAVPVVDASGGVPVTGTETTTGTLAGNTTAALSPPNFSISGAARTLAELAGAGVGSSGVLTLSITNPNVGIPSHLSSAGSISIVPSSTEQIVASRVISDDLDFWTDSSTVTNSYSVTPFDPTVSISPSSQTFSPYDLGVPPASGSSNTTVTATISNWSAIPEIFRNSSNFQLVMATGTASLLSLSGAAEPSTSTTVSTSSPWVHSTNSATLSVTAMVKALASGLFNNSAVATASLTVAKPTLGLTFTPSSGTELTATGTITISGTGTLPANYVISYTTTGASNASGSVTGGSISLSPPASGSIAVNATISPPATYSTWFVSGSASASYTVNAQSGSGLPSGILTSSLILNSNGLIQGSLTLVEIPGQTLKFDMNSNARVTGDVFLPGKPTITKNANVSIGGGIVDLTGSATPTYSVTLNSNAKIDGTVYRRSQPVTMPTVTAPTGLTNFSGTTVDNQKTATLPPGNYTSTINANAQATINIGTAGSSTPQQYIFNGLNMSSGSTLNVLGPVIITMTQNANFNANTIIGNSAHPEYLQINIVSGDFTVNSNVSVYAMVVSPNGRVTFNSNSTFKGSVTAKEVIINSNSAAVEFSLPPVQG